MLKLLSRLTPGRRAMVFIHLFLAIQIALPLYYYYGRRDQNDERFAWRMFSPTRMLECRPRFFVGEAKRPVNPRQVFHEAWVELAERGRMMVVERMAARLCADNPGEPVYVDLQCKGVGDERQSYGGGWDLCTVGAL